MHANGSQYHGATKVRCQDEVDNQRSIGKFDLWY